MESHHSIHPWYCIHMETKTCTKCKKDKPLSEYYKKSQTKDGLMHTCKSCDKDYRKTTNRWGLWARENREHCEQLKAQHIASRQRLVEEIKADRECADCQNCFPPVCMDFDHVRGEKRLSISEMVRTGYSEKSILEEIDKCDLVCANCHRIRTHKSGRATPWNKRKYDRTAW